MNASVELPYTRCLSSPVAEEQYVNCTKLTAHVDEACHNGGMPHPLRTIVAAAKTSAILLVVYLLFWAVRYRMPFDSGGVIDMRADKNAVPYRVEIRASLASNPHGFPGHAYVVWQDGENAGYVPARAQDQISSLFSRVPGCMQFDGDRSNRINLNKLSVIVDKQEYERTKALAHAWNTHDFKVGERDCVAFVNAIASELQLHRPKPYYKFPQDYVAELCLLNRTKQGTQF